MFKRGFTPPQPPVDVIPSDLGLRFEVVELRSVNDTRLHAWWIPAEGAAPVIVVLHGWGGNSSLMLPLAPHIHDAGFHALFVDARNHGLSEHDSFSSMPRFAEDLEVAVAWVRERHDATAVGVIGHSVGAGALIFSASKGVPIDAAVSVSSFAHPGEMMHENMPFPKPVVKAILEAVQRTIGYRFDDFAPRVRVVAVDIPLLLVHGDNDDVVPITNLHQLADAHGGAEVIIVPGGGHSDLTPFEPYIDDIVAFFTRNLPADVPSGPS
jgi:pimeloyl-ACP methyl ester carboxylesterase